MKKKGFTLIELLAVIVILALIALIAVPLVLNVIEDAKKGAAKESATNYVKQVENVLVVSLLDGTSVITTGLYTVEDGSIKSPVTLEVPMKGDKAKEGRICIGERGSVTSYSLKIGNYYITSSDGTTQRITDTLVELDCKEAVVPTPTPVTKLYEDGTIVYYNPTTGEKCSESEANSDTGTKSGCMKWYAFLDSEGNDTVKLLLDHNTTATVAWNSSGSNTSGMKEVKTALEADTTGWKSEEIPRLITGEEVAEISGNTDWSSSFEDLFYFGSNNSSDKSLRGEYGWLYDRTDVNCIENGCANNSNRSMGGYWTSTSHEIWPSEAWEVNRYGFLCYSTITPDRENNNHFGVRPVIVVLKSTVS